MSVNNSALRATAGQNFGAGGDYFTPGEHIVRVDEVDFFKSKENEACDVFLVKGEVIESKGGSHTWAMVNGKAELVTPTPAEPMRPGQATSWIQKTSNMQIFKPRVGNFSLAVKKAFLQEMGEPSPGRDAVIDKLWKSPEDRVRVRKFLQTGATSPDITLEDDAIDILELGLAKGLYLKVSCSEKGTKDRSKVITNSEWKVLPQAEVDRIEKLVAEMADE